MIAFRNSSTNSISGVGISVADPGQPGDFLLAFFSSDDNSDAATAPDATWILIHDVALTSVDGQRGMIWYKLSAVGSGSYSFGSSVGADKTLSIVAYSGVSQEVPIEADTELVDDTSHASPWNIPATGVTTTSDGCVLIYAAMDDPNDGSGGATFTDPSGFTNRISTSFTFQDVLVSEMAQGTAGSTGTITGTIARPGVNAGYFGVLIALRPDPGPITSVIQFVDHTEGDITFSTDLTIDKPALAVQGNFLIVFFTILTSDHLPHPLTPPDGTWSTEGIFGDGTHGLDCVIWWKFLGASEPSTYTFTTDSSFNNFWNVVAYSGVDTGSPVVDRASSSDFGFFFELPSVNPSKAGDMLLGYLTSHQRTPDPPDFMTLRSRHNADTDENQAIYDEIVAKQRTQDKIGAQTGGNMVGVSLIIREAQSSAPILQPIAPVGVLMAYNF